MEKQRRTSEPLANRRCTGATDRSCILPVHPRGWIVTVEYAPVVRGTGVMQVAKDKKDKAAAGSIEATLLRLAQPKMSPKELLKLTRKAHPEASKKEIVRAAFHSIISVAASAVD